MLDGLIQQSLRHRVLVVCMAAAVCVYGALVLRALPVDVFPDLNRPTVTLLTEAGGLSPEEVELMVSAPIELALNGAPGVVRVRSVSSVGLSVVTVEFDWQSELYRSRQVVTERLQAVQDRLPANVVPHMGPVASIMGEIMLVGLSSTTGATSPMEVRTRADWLLRPRLLSIPGIAQVIPIGGGVAQVQVHVKPDRLLAYGVSLDDVERAAASAQLNSTGGFVAEQGQELLVRTIARSDDIDDFADTVVRYVGGVPVRLRDVADVGIGAAEARGAAGVDGLKAVVLSIHKQPGTSSIELTKQVEQALAELRMSLPVDVHMTTLFRQATFIEAAIRNVQEALRDGAILVLIVLVLFLLNLRTTIITLTAIPLSLLISVLVFRFFGLSINTMTLGGMAIAIGELVDDAIVDVENVWRRLRLANQNGPLTSAQAVQVVFVASREVRKSIVVATMLVVLVFVPLFAMEGMEGRLFIPLGIAYVVSIVASLLVSLTVTPALCALLLPQGAHGAHHDGALVRWLQAQQQQWLQRMLPKPWPLLAVTVVMVVVAMASVPFLGSDFLPAFNEGTATVSVVSKPGISLAESDRLGTMAERLLMDIPEVKHVGRRTGRAEQDEHAEGVHNTELDVDFHAEDDGHDDPHDVQQGHEHRDGHVHEEAHAHDFSRDRPRAEVLQDIRTRLQQLPGVQVSVGQPISHRLDHILSGVRAQVVVKLFGDDLATLRSRAAAMQEAMAKIPGVVDLQVENQVLIPQMRIDIDPRKAQRYGVVPGVAAERLQTAMAGKVVGQVMRGAKRIDVVVRYHPSARDQTRLLPSLMIDADAGQHIPLQAIADVQHSQGPNQIIHDHAARRLVVSCNVAGRDIGSVAKDIEAALAALPRMDGMYTRMEGRFESQQAASRTIAWLAACSLLAMVATLWTHFRQWRLVLQVLVNIPLALVGAVAALWLWQLPLSVATMVGFITLCGIATRNTTLMIDRYLFLLHEEKQPFDLDTIIRGSRERLIPVLMTALTAGLALVPLAFASGAPGKEILHPVAVVILGGLLCSTLIDIVLTPTMFFHFSGRRIDTSHTTLDPRDDESPPSPRHDPGSAAV
jgi:Cu/Ag efflux pump CusA